MSRAKPCDCCRRPRLGWQRLCDACFAVLPAHIRANLIAAHRERRATDWRRWRRMAREWIKDRERHREETTRLYMALAARVVGEQEETHG